MAVRKRGGSWEVRLEIGGREISRSLGAGSTKADARELETRIKRDVVDGKVGRAPKRTISEAIERWLDGEAKGHKDARGDDTRTRMWLEYIQGEPLSNAVAVAAKASDAWIAAGLAPGTINRRIALLRRVCRLAHSRWGWLTEDLSRKLVALPGERSCETFLSREQVMTLARAADRRMRDAILLSAYTGLRQGELLRLQPGDVADGCVIVRTGKTKTSERLIPVPRQALPILKRLPIKMTLHELDYWWRDLRKRTGIQARWHDLRHTYGSWLAQSGAPPTVIRDLMGHSTLTMTSRYTHTAPEHVRAAVRKLK